MGGAQGGCFYDGGGKWEAVSVLLGGTIIGVTNNVSGNQHHQQVDMAFEQPHGTQPTITRLRTQPIIHEIITARAQHGIITPKHNQEILGPEQPRNIGPRTQPRNIGPRTQPRNIWPRTQPRNIGPRTQPRNIGPRTQPRIIRRTKQPGEGTSPNSSLNQSTFRNTKFTSPICQTDDWYQKFVRTYTLPVECKSYTYTRCCVCCSETFQSKFDFESHLKNRGCPKPTLTKNTNPTKFIFNRRQVSKPIRCNFCLETYLCRNDFLVHEGRHHKSDYLCCPKDRCNVTRTGLKSLEEHIRQYHCNAKPENACSKSKVVPPKCPTVTEDTNNECTLKATNPLISVKPFRSPTFEGLAFGKDNQLISNEANQSHEAFPFYNPTEQPSSTKTINMEVPESINNYPETLIFSNLSQIPTYTDTCCPICNQSFLNLGDHFELLHQSDTDQQLFVKKIVFPSDCERQSYQFLRPCLHGDCGKRKLVFVSRLYFEAHLKNKHPLSFHDYLNQEKERNEENRKFLFHFKVDKPHWCSFCSLLFTSRDDFLCHQQRQHRNDYVGCHICSKFLPYDIVSRHLLNVHLLWDVHYIEEPQERAKTKSLNQLEHMETIHIGKHKGGKLIEDDDSNISDQTTKTLLNGDVFMGADKM